MYYSDLIWFSFLFFFLFHCNKELERSRINAVLQILKYQRYSENKRLVTNVCSDTVLKLHGTCLCSLAVEG